MKISEAIKELKKHQKALGDVKVFADLNNMEHNTGHGEYSHEEVIHFVPEKIGECDMDTGKISKKKFQVLSIKIAELT